MTPRDRYTCEWVECLHADDRGELIGAGDTVTTRTAEVDRADGAAPGTGSSAMAATSMASTAGCGPKTRATSSGVSPERVRT